MPKVDPEDTSPDLEGGDNSSTIASSLLRSFVERIERLEEEKKTYAEDIREVYAEAKGNGLDPKIIRIVVRERKMDHDVRMERRALTELYLAALGMA